METVREYSHRIARLMDVHVPDNFFEQYDLNPDAACEPHRTYINEYMSRLEPTQTIASARPFTSEESSLLNLTQSDRSVYVTGFVKSIERNFVNARNNVSSHFRDYLTSLEDYKVSQANLNDVLGRKYKTFRELVLEAASVPFFQLKSVHKGFVVFVTEPIELTDSVTGYKAPFGRFQIKYKPNFKFTIEPHENNNFAYNNTFGVLMHPFMRTNVGDGNLCFGDSVDDFQNAVRADDARALFCLIRDVLTTYDKGAVPYDSLDKFPTDRRKTCVKCNRHNNSCLGCADCGLRHADCKCGQAPAATDAGTPVEQAPAETVTSQEDTDFADGSEDIEEDF